MPSTRRLPKLRISKKDQRIARPNPGPLSLARARAAETGADFPVGAREVYLPNIVISLLYNPLIPPTHSQFRVPLHFNKLDLRDYLWHVYNLRVSSIRSNVIQQRIRIVEKYSVKDIPGHKIAFRPMAIKKMVVRLEKPFVWPAVPRENELAETERAEMEMWKAGKEELAGMMDSTAKEKVKRAEKKGKMAGLARRAAALAERRMEWRGDGREFYTRAEKEVADAKMMNLGREAKADKKVQLNEAQVVPPKAEKAVVGSAVEQAADPTTLTEPSTLVEPEDEALTPPTHQQKVQARALFLRRNGLRPQGAEAVSNKRKQPLLI